MKKLFLITLSTLLFSTCTQKNAGQDPCDRFDELAIEMQTLYDQILIDYRTDRLFLRRFKESQSKWTGYRNSFIGTLYAGHEDTYGETHRECRCRELNKLSEYRIAHLRRWVTNPDDPEKCLNSTNTAKK